MPVALPRPAVLLVCALACLVRGAEASGSAPPELTARLSAALGSVAPEEAAVLALPETRAALREQLARAGVSEREGIGLVDALVVTAKGAAWQEPLMSVGPFALSVAQVRAIAGPREGRDRGEVAARLRQADPRVAATLTGGELLALVPEVVAADLRHSADGLLSRVTLALGSATEEQ